MRVDPTHLMIQVKSVFIYSLNIHICIKTNKNIILSVAFNRWTFAPGNSIRVALYAYLSPYQPFKGMVSIAFALSFILVYSLHQYFIVYMLHKSDLFKDCLIHFSTRFFSHTQTAPTSLFLLCKLSLFISYSLDA